MANLFKRLCTLMEVLVSQSFGKGHQHFMLACRQKLLKLKINSVYKVYDCDLAVVYKIYSGLL